MREETIKILKIEVGKEPYVKEIPNKLEAMQEEVGGLIQPIDMDDNCVVVVNDEGKINGMLPNRWLGKSDIICGDFYICSDAGENFGSLSEKQIETCKELFGKIPEFTGQEEELEPKGFIIGFYPMEGMK